MRKVAWTTVLILTGASGCASVKGMLGMSSGSNEPAQANKAESAPSTVAGATGSGAGSPTSAPTTAAAPATAVATSDGAPQAAAASSTAPAAARRSAFPDPAPIPTEAFIVPSSIRITSDSVNCYMPKPGADCKGTAWYPRFTFNLVGPIARSAKVKIYVEQDGKQWFKYDFRSIELKPNDVEVMTMDNVDSAATGRQLTGTFGFKITAEDALSGTTKVLYAGTFKADKHHTGNDHPNFKNQFSWFVNYDWMLPVAYLDFSRHENNARDPGLQAHFWFRDGFEKKEEYSAHIFRDGKELENRETGPAWSIESKSEFKKVMHGWSLVSFNFTRVVAHYWPEGGWEHPNAYDLSANPGEYEIKVIRNGELARIARFKILPNGKLDNSINTSNKLTGFWVVVPAKVVGGLDGTWDKEAWKKGAFWGHQLTGFSPPK